MFTDEDIIYAYTWDDACDDGTFVNVSRLAKGAGFTLPVAITNNLYVTHLEGKTDNDTDLRTNTLLMLLAIHIKGLKEQGKAATNRIVYHASFGSDEEGVTEVWVNIEARCPKNPEPVMTIMLPSDY